MRIVRVEPVENYTTAANQLLEKGMVTLGVDDPQASFKGEVTFRPGLQLSGQTSGNHIPQAVVCPSSNYLLAVVSFTYPAGYDILVAFGPDDRAIRVNLTGNRITFFKRLRKLLNR